MIVSGRPQPTLSWWYNGTLLDGVVDTTRDAFITVNQLLIKKVTRSLKGSQFECRTSSLEIAADIVRVVPVIIYRMYKFCFPSSKVKEKIHIYFFTSIKSIFINHTRRERIYLRYQIYND